MFRRPRVMTFVLAIVVAAFVGVFVVRNSAPIGELFGSIGSIDTTIALLGVSCSVLAMANRGMLNRAAHRAVGLEAGMGAMTHTAAVGFAAQKMVKSAGAAALTVFVRHGRRRGYNPAEVAAACVLTALASFVALGSVLIFAMGTLAATGRLTGWWFAAAIGFAIYATIVIALSVAIARRPQVAIWVWQLGQRIRRRLPRGDRTGASDAPFPDELFDAFAAARRRPAAVRQVVVHAALSKLLGAMMLATAMMASGLATTMIDALLIYAAVLAASMVTIVPGGFGTVEGSMAALLLASGATAGAAALAVGLFRLFDLWLPVLTGAAAARLKLRGRQPSPAPSDETHARTMHPSFRPIPVAA